MNLVLHSSVRLAIACSAFGVWAACQSTTPANDTAPNEIHTPTYDLLLPAEQKALLILFPCFPCDAADTRSESPIADTAVANGIAVLMMNFNRHILMSDAEKREVLDTIAAAVKAQGVDATNTFIGGFSSGGNVSVLLAKELVRAPRPGIGLKGVFAVDSPLDLVHLYECSLRDLAKSSFPEYKDEARYLQAFLDSTLGSPTDSMVNYERSAPLLNSSASVAPLKDLPIRFYTEPDTAWWRANRDDRYEELNAYSMKRIHNTLVAAGNARAEYITTEGRGVQHGNRHPHAWSIVDERELVRWIRDLSL
jgi:acetyl esterase/lipase